MKTTRITPVVIRPGGTLRMVSMKEALSHFEYKNEQKQQKKSNKDVFERFKKNSS